MNPRECPSKNVVQNSCIIQPFTVPAIVYIFEHACLLSSCDSHYAYGGGLLKLDGW